MDLNQSSEAFSTYIYPDSRAAASNFLSVRRHCMNKNILFWRTARVVATILVVLVMLLRPSPALAAPVPPTPTAPTHLDVTASTRNGVTLARNTSTEQSGKVTDRLHMVSPSTEKVANQTNIARDCLRPYPTCPWDDYAVNKA